jgi:PAS domain-containing protein
MSFDFHAADLRSDADFLNLLAGSHVRIVGKPLLPNGRGADWLYNDAPFVVLAHNTDPDPRFIYANKAGQALFEYTWDEFITLPSRLSAEPENRADRQRLLDAVTRNGFTDSYRGVRISKSGRRFRIENAVVWQLIDNDGVRRGQAATFSTWQPL